MSEFKKSVINRGSTALTLRPGPDGAVRVLHPGKSIECLDEAEFKLLSGYRTIADADVILPQTSKRIETLEKALAEAKAENAKLVKTLPKEEPKREEEEEKEPVAASPSRKKGK